MASCGDLKHLAEKEFSENSTGMEQDSDSDDELTKKKHQNNSQRGIKKRKPFTTPVVRHKTYENRKRECLLAKDVLASVHQFFVENGRNVYIGKAENTVINTNAGNDNVILNDMHQSFNQFKKRYEDDQLASSAFMKKVTEYIDLHPSQNQWEKEYTEQLQSWLLKLQKDEVIFSTGMEALKITTPGSERTSFDNQKTGTKVMVRRLLQIFGQAGLKDLNNLLKIPMSDELKTACAGKDCFPELNEESCTILVSEWTLNSGGDEDTLWVMVKDYIRKRTQNDDVSSGSDLTQASEQTKSPTPKLRSFAARSTATVRPLESLQPGIQEKIKLLEKAKWDEKPSKSVISPLPRCNPFQIGKSQDT